MREQTRKLKELLDEFEKLKAEIFGDCSFIAEIEGPQADRYSQLLGLFYPQFRTKGWVNPSSNFYPKGEQK